MLEIGAAWALDSSTYPIVIPPMTRAEASTYLGETSTGFLGSDTQVDALFSELSDRIQQTFSYKLHVSDWNEAVQKFKADRPVAEIASQGDDDPMSNESEIRMGTDVRHSKDVDERTRQEQIAPFLELIRKRQGKTEVYVRVSGKDAWLGFSTSAIRQFGMDSNTVHIYYKNPVGETRPRLDTVASWNEEMSLGRFMEVIRRILRDPERREMADFRSERVIEDLRNKLYELSGI